MQEFSAVSVVVDILLGIAFVCLWWRQNRLYAKQARSIEKEGLLNRKLSVLKEVEDKYTDFRHPMSSAQVHNKTSLKSSLDQARLSFTDKIIVDAITALIDDKTRRGAPNRGRWDQVERIICLMKNDIAEHASSI